MGREARCLVRYRGKKEVAAVYLESDYLELRTTPPYRLPLKTLKIASIEGGWLTLATLDGPMALELGPDAPKWGRAIANPKTRAEKLGVKEGDTVCVIGLDDPAFEAELTGRGATISRELGGQHALIFFGVHVGTDLDRIPALRGHLLEDGALWLVRVKGKGAPVSENEAREAALSAGLVDVKVASFDDTRTAEKYVVPLARRGGGQ